MKDQVTHQFGDKIRKIRERKGVTLKDVASRIGVSESLVSQIERNKVSPSVDTLIAIADALNIDLEYLFRDYKKRKGLSIIREGSRTVHTQEGLAFEELSIISENDDEYAIEAFVLTIDPDYKKEDKEYGHKGQELGFILEGEADITYGGETHMLKAGDCVSFPSDVPHSLRNRSKKKMKALWIVTPPRLFSSNA
ncbi:MAG: helix-turn-helix transcriptional regulator [Spirochaetales bacterium]|nr:helix-turn-helix transcriptional regulator [Spirochaetales bacterium]